MKRTRVHKSIVVIFFVFVLCLTWRFVVYERNARSDVVNCYKLQEGMTHQEVLSIMGAPKTQVEYNGKVNYQNVEILKYHYNPPYGASSGVDVYFDKSTKRVLKVVCDE